MGKFVILPRHRKSADFLFDCSDISSSLRFVKIAASNDFFYKFPNCLPYDSLGECATKLKYALEHDPEPLNEETRRMLSWEGATERLYKAAAITKSEQKARDESDMGKERLKAVKFHLNSCRRSQFVTNLFSGSPIKKLSSQLSSKNDG